MLGSTTAAGKREPAVSVATHNLRWLPAETVIESQWTRETDVYSFGVIVWQLFRPTSAAVLPHSSNPAFADNATAFESVWHTRAWPQLEFGGGTPASVRTVAQSCLCSVPADRQAMSVTVNTLLDHLQGPGRWEVPHDALCEVEKLGEGQFGSVFKMMTGHFSGSSIHQQS